MIRSQWLSFIFLAAFAISLAHTITPHSHANVKSVRSHAHHHDGKNSHGHSSSDKPVVAHFSNSDFVGSAQVNFSAAENSVENCLLPASLFSLSAPVFYKLSVTARKHGKPPSGPLLSVLSLRAPPITL